MTNAEECYDYFSFAYCGIKDFIAWDSVPNMFTLCYVILTIISKIKKNFTTK